MELTRSEWTVLPIRTWRPCQSSAVLPGSPQTEKYAPGGLTGTRGTSPWASKSSLICSDDQASSVRAATATSSPAIGEDRKSTRLNSSHVAISYAVFCLKKKKKKESNTQTEIKYTHTTRIR